MITKVCATCKSEFPLNEAFWYPLRKKDRKNTGWQSHCRNCWPLVNKANKEKRKQKFTFRGGAEA